MDTLRMPRVVGLDVYAASKVLRKLGVEFRYEQVQTDTAKSAQFFVAGQIPDSGAVLSPGQGVVLRFNCTAMLRYAGDYAVPLLGDFKHQVSFYRASKPPEPIARPAAAYPTELLKYTFNGQAGVEVLVDYDGTVLAARLVESSGYEQADSSALAAAMQATFSPAQHLEQPVRVWFPLTYPFVYSDLKGLPPPTREGTPEGE